MKLLYRDNGLSTHYCSFNVRYLKNFDCFSEEKLGVDLENESIMSMMVVQVGSKAPSQCNNVCAKLTSCPLLSTFH